MKKGTLVFGVLVLMASGCQKASSPSTQTNQAAPIKQEQIVADNKNSRQVSEPNFNESCFNNSAFSQIVLQDYDINSSTSDQMLKKINTTLDPSCVILKSVRAEIPEMQSNPKAALGRWQTNQGSFFDVRERPHYQTLSVFYRFDKTDGKFKKLRNISALTMGTPVASSYSQCLTNDVIAFVPNPPDGNSKALYLLDLATDSYKKAVVLSDNETFNYSNHESPSDDVLCQDENKFRYAVYEIYNTGEKALKTYRDLQIK